MIRRLWPVLNVGQQVEVLLPSVLSLHPGLFAFAGGKPSRNTNDDDPHAHAPVQGIEFGEELTETTDLMFHKSIILSPLICHCFCDPWKRDCLSVLSVLMAFGAPEVQFLSARSYDSTN